MRPGRHVFVTGEGKIARSKRFSLRENGFILVFSTTADWTAFTEEAVDSSVSADRIYRELSAVEVDSKDKFNQLLWVNPDSLNEDIEINAWYKLSELYLYTHTYTDIFKKILKTPSVIESKESSQSEPKPAKSTKFNFKLLDKDNADFIEENMAPSTLRVTRVAVTLFDKFMQQAHPELLHATLATAEESRLPELISEFFKVLQKNEGESYNAGTLQTYYLALARFLKQKRNIVMKNNHVFEQTRDVLGRQQRISCKNGQRPGLHKSHAFPPEVLAEGWAKGAFGASDPKALIAALVLHMGPTLGIRGKEEQAQMLNVDLIEGARRPDGVLSFLRFSERITKTRKGVDGQGARKIEPMIYPDDARPDRCPLRLYDLYQSKKPDEMRTPDSRFFLGVRNNTTKPWKKVGAWFVSQPMGKNTLSTVVTKQIESKNINTKGLKLTGVSTR